MSIPIKYCFVVEAAENPDVFKKLHSAMHQNLKGGHFTVLPCDHDPQCRELEDEEWQSMVDRWRKPVDGEP